MTDARFLSINSVTFDANRVKCEKLMQNSWGYKKPYFFRNQSKGSPLQGDSLSKNGNFSLFGAVFPPHAPNEVKFSTAKRTLVPVGRAKFHVNRCNESPLLGEKPDFRHLALRAILPVITNLFLGKLLRTTVKRFKTNIHNFLRLRIKNFAKSSGCDQN